MLRLGHKQKGRKERIAAIQEELARPAGLGREPLRPPRLAAARQPTGSPSRSTCIERNARFIDAADRDADRRRAASRRCVQAERGATLVTVYAKDQPGPVLPHRRRDQPGRRQHHRRAHPHHRRRHGARQFPGPGPGRRRRSPTATSSKRLEEAVLTRARRARSRRPTGSRRGRCRCAAPRLSRSSPRCSSITRPRTATR